MDLSIIVPVYNVEKYIKSCFDSIFSNFKNFFKVEIIFINDGSTDASLQILEELYQELPTSFKEKIKIISQKNRGLSGARNTGINIANGKYIYFLDSDDFLDNAFFDEILPLLKNEYDIIEFDSIKFYVQDSKFFKKYHRNTLDSGLKNIKNINNQNQFKIINFSSQDWAVWYRVFNRALITKNFFPEGYLYEDVMTVPFLYDKVEKIYSINKSLIHYRYNPNSIMTTKNSKCEVSINHALEKFDLNPKSAYLDIVRARFIIAATENLLKNISIFETFKWLMKNHKKIEPGNACSVSSRKLLLSNSFPLLTIFYFLFFKR